MKNSFESERFPYQIISNSDILRQNAALYSETVKNLKPLLHDFASECAIHIAETLKSNLYFERTSAKNNHSLDPGTLLRPEELYLPFKKIIKEFEDVPDIYNELCACFAFGIVNELRKITDLSSVFLSLMQTSDNQNTDNLTKKETQIAYMKSIYTDEAFYKFSSYMQNPTIQVHDSFVSACEEVYYGNLPYCILPYSTSQGGIIESFRRLADKYDLKLRMLCNVQSSDDESTTVYALLSSCITDSVLQTSPTHLDCSFVPISAGSFSIGAFLHALRFFKTSLCQINTIPLSYSQDQFEYRITLDVTRSDLYAIFLYLNILLPQYNVIGLYTHI